MILLKALINSENGLIFLLGSFLLLWTIIPSKKKSHTKSKTTRKPEILPPSNSDPLFELETCQFCKGAGYQIICSVCHSNAAHEGFSENYDGDAFCPNCREQGLPDDNIIEELCSFCGGTGKEN